MRYIPSSVGCGLDDLHDLQIPLRCGNDDLFRGFPKNDLHNDFLQPACHNGHKHKSGYKSEYKPEYKEQTLFLFLLFIMVLNIVLLLLVLFRLLK